MASALRQVLDDPIGQPQRIPIYRNEPEFIDRINNPQNYPVIQNPDGSVSTHRMAAESDAQGNFYVFPTIQMEDGRLVEYEDNRQAMDAAFRSGNILQAPNMLSALRYAEGGYKQGTPLAEDQQAARRELEKRGVNPDEVAQAPVPSNQSVMAAPTSWNPFNPAFRETARSFLNNYFGGSNIAGREGYRTGQLVDTAVDALDFIPGVGDAMGVGDLRQSIGSGDLIGTAVDTTALAAGMIPVVGDAASKAIKAGKSNLRESFRIGDEGFDARFDDRALEQDRIQNTELQYDVRPFERPEVSIYDLEGRPFRLTMSDRTAAGRDLTGVEGVEYDIPINLQGGQDFMFANPLGREGQVWAQDKGATSKYLNSFLGLDGQPMGDEFLMLPFRMSPAGGDFATMTGEVMVTHARNNVPARAKRQADEKIRQFYPTWKGIDNPESLQQISEMKGDPRKALLNVMDKDLRNEGGLGIGQARLAVSDRSQYNALDTGLQNVGIATPNIVSVNRRGRPILERFEDSGHRTYEQGLAGRPMGTLIEQDISAYELLPDYLIGRGFRNFEDLMASDPSVLANEAFTLRRGTRGGTITEDMLRDIERRRSQ